MENLNLDKIKYSSDRFYVCLDGFDLNKLTSFLNDGTFEEQHSIFIHEYYHFLTNISTFPGIRQFHLNFCDRFRLITILLSKRNLSAFPISKNTFADCVNEIADFKRVSEIIDEDDIDFELAKETVRSQNKSFEIVNIYPYEKVYPGGKRTLVKIEISGIVGRNDFNLSYSAMDEFLSAAIDEYLFENDFSVVEGSFLSSRPFYPYLVFDKILSYYDIQRPSSFEKIIILYVALNSFNPPLRLTQILEKIKTDGVDKFRENPELYLINEFKEPIEYDNLLSLIKSFAEETKAQKRYLISQSLSYYYDKFLISQKFKEKDPFYFIRPFFNGNDKSKFLLDLSRIVNVFTPPVILYEKSFYTIDKLTNFGECTMLLLASYEIFESLKNHKIAIRPKFYKEKYLYPDHDLYCDIIETFEDMPKKGSSFQLALNEMSLFGEYIKVSQPPN